MSHPHTDPEDDPPPVPAGRVPALAFLLLVTLVTAAAVLGHHVAGPTAARWETAAPARTPA